MGHVFFQDAPTLMLVIIMHWPVVLMLPALMRDVPILLPVTTMHWQDVMMALALIPAAQTWLLVTMMPPHCATMIHAYCLYAQIKPPAIFQT
jgi:hypothetical protein